MLHCADWCPQNRTARQPRWPTAPPSSTMSACFTIWHERTRGLAQVSRLRTEHDDVRTGYTQREAKLTQECAEAKAAAKAAVLRLLNAADTLGNPSAHKLVRLRLFDGVCAESKLVEELGQLLQIPAVRLRFVCVRYEPQLEACAEKSQPATVDVEILPALSSRLVIERETRAQTRGGDYHTHSVSPRAPLRGR